MHYEAMVTRTGRPELSVFGLLTVGGDDQVQWKKNVEKVDVRRARC
jgi:hypothetical protein